MQPGVLGGERAGAAGSLWAGSTPPGAGDTAVGITEKEPHENKQRLLIRSRLEQGSGPASLAPDRDSKADGGAGKPQSGKKRRKASGVDRLSLLNRTLVSLPYALGPCPWALSSRARILLKTVKLPFRRLRALGPITGLLSCPSFSPRPTGLGAVLGPDVIQKMEDPEPEPVKEGREGVSRTVGIRRPELCTEDPGRRVPGSLEACPVSPSSEPPRVHKLPSALSSWFRGFKFFT
nr:uncharacterized protein LOC106845918 [Equus asinus]